jgi:hypothetical protein
VRALHPPAFSDLISEKVQHANNISLHGMPVLHSAPDLLRCAILPPFRTKPRTPRPPGRDQHWRAAKGVAMTPAEARMRILAEWRTWIGHRQAADSHTTAEVSAFVAELGQSQPDLISFESTEDKLQVDKGWLLDARLIRYEAHKMSRSRRGAGAPTGMRGHRSPHPRRLSVNPLGAAGTADIRAASMPNRS